MGKYEKGDFYDPVVRCVACAKIVHRQFIDQHGACNHCGNRRFNNVTGLTHEEFHALEKGQYDLAVRDYHLDDENWVAWISDWEPVEGANA